ncbi:squalene synthetase [Coccidioides immitis RMSCC 3703]|uniref:Squalene synthetase n=2 Tax=Coccidioides immitis TaxID=5501 RepID=A0A0J8RC73_COCIT|nr:squalene synthetase [Coccidioides immitis RMSCC 2394]KMU82030.1 squalene synthetase [Coccidioides immitis RMSCC 3703]
MGILVVQASNQMPCRLNYPVPFAFAETNIYSITIEPLSAHSLPKCRPPEMLSTTSSTSRSCAPSSSDDMAETRPPARREQGVAQCEGMLPLPRVDIALRRSPYHVTSTPTSTTRTGPFDGSGPDEKDREVLVKFDCVAREFNLLKHEYRAIIKDIAKGMGNFMADYAKMADENANGLSVKNIKDYELYRHYVAGLVDEGLTRLNIRDIREDYDSKRYFWPEEVWSKYVENFSDLFLPQNREKALQRSSEMVLMALTRADESIFDRNIKISRGSACQIMIESTRDFQHVCEVFRRRSEEKYAQGGGEEGGAIYLVVATLGVITAVMVRYVRQAWSVRLTRHDRLAPAGFRVEARQPFLTLILWRGRKHIERVQ